MAPTYADGVATVPRSSGSNHEKIPKVKITVNSIIRK